MAVGAKEYNPAATSLPDLASHAGEFLKVSAGELTTEWATLAGGGDMLAANNLSDVVSASTALSNIGGQPLDTDLTAIAALVSAANKVPYATGAGTWAVADFTAAGRTMVAAANAAAQLAIVTPLTTKGDIFVYGAASTRLAVGAHADGEVLTLDAAEATGMKWAAAAGGGADADATYIVQTASDAPANAQVLASLATGIVKNTTTTGALSIAAANTDYLPATAEAIVTIANADTNVGVRAASFAHTTSGTAAASFGVDVGYQLEDASGNAAQDAAVFRTRWTTATHASEAASSALALVAAGTVPAAGSEQHIWASNGDYTATGRLRVGTGGTSADPGIRFAGAANGVFFNSGSDNIGLALASTGAMITLSGNYCVLQGRVWAGTSTAAEPVFVRSSDSDCGLHLTGSNAAQMIIGSSKVAMEWSEPGDGEVAITIRKNVGGVFTTERVTMVAGADVAGSGRKFLSVAA
jgi:hypothetical protein